jgi:hypothetical protein
VFGGRASILFCVGALVASAAVLAFASRYEAQAHASSAAPLGDPALSAAGTALAGKPLTVRCWSRSEWSVAVSREVAASGRNIAGQVLGFAHVGGRSISLAPRVCARLRALEGGAQPDDLLTSAAALVTIAHESWHARGVANEAVTECRAIQTATRAGRLLGVDPLYARLAVTLYWAHYPEELPAYRSAQCHDGGALDLRPASSVWP